MIKNELQPLKMQKRIYSILLLICLVGIIALAHEGGTAQDTIYNPTIQYTMNPKTYEIAGISVSGVQNYEDYPLNHRIFIPAKAEASFFNLYL